MCLISLAGLPLVPAGFIAKFFLFASIFSSGFSFAGVLTLIGLIGSVVALFYYTYLIKVMLVDDVSTAVKALSEKDESPSRMIQFATFAAVAKLIFVGIFMMDFLKNISADSVLKAIS